jgi:hypothetical protein
MGGRQKQDVVLGAKRVKSLFLTLSCRIGKKFVDGETASNAQGASIKKLATHGGRRHDQGLLLESRNSKEGLLSLYGWRKQGLPQVLCGILSH